MLRPRVIPCLLLSDGGLVKTRRFTHPQYVGDPNNAIRIFNEKEADELIVIDISATREGRGPDLSAIEDFASECFMPLTYGGGIRSAADAAQLFELGVEKVCLQSAALADPTIVTDIAARFGSQAVVVALDVERDRRGRQRLRRGRSTPRSEESWTAWLTRFRDAGAGEILLTDVHREGTLAGLDLDLTRQASASVDIPVVVNGGVSSIDDIRAGLDAGASAIAAGSFFVFYGPHRAVLISYPGPRDFTLIAGEK